jgi:hypothetical protein
MIATREEIAVVHLGHVVILRPSLRAASLLERLHDGWPALLRKVEEFDTSTITAIIRAAASDRSAAEALLATFSTRPIAELHKTLSGPLSALLMGLLEIDDTDDTRDDKPAPASAPLPWAKAYTQLFEIGTGWLGWTPAETWAATPAEISAAMKGHVAKLKAMHGGTDDEAPAHARPAQNEAQRQANLEAGLDPDFDRHSLRALKARHA